MELLGSKDHPLLWLLDAETQPMAGNDYDITAEKAVADWLAMTNAALYFGTVFRIRGKQDVHAVLRRHPANRSGAFEYGRPQVEELTQTATQLFQKQSNVLQEQREVLEELRKTTEHFNTIWRDFQKEWRDLHNLSEQNRLRPHERNA
ncbi:hypothetical protein [Rhodoblastus sp.]|uniref:hypothetical protein n=1 Tax=Rhodoblastus sp. TaxID=1962975 RepID=UPI003F995B6A